MGHYLKENNLEGVETLIRELTEDMLLTVENTTLYEDVQESIIHGQIMLQKYFIWKNIKKI